MFGRNFIKELKPENRRDFCASQGLFEEAMQKFGNKNVINPAYNDYGGTFMDKVLIQFFLQEFPDRICVENTSWCGENAIIMLENDNEFRGDWIYTLESDDVNFCDFYHEKQSELVAKEVDEYISDTKSFDGIDYSEYRDEIQLWMEEHGSPQPNQWDYYAGDLDDYMKEMKETA